MQAPSPERIALALALLGCGAMVSMGASEGPAILPLDAASHVGQDVAVKGYVRDLTVRDGIARFVLAAEGHGVAVLLDGPPPDPGALVTVQGRLSALGGIIRLHGDGHELVAAPPALPVPLSVVAADPAPWTDRLLRIQGVPGPDGLGHGSTTLRATGLAAAARVHVTEGVLRYEADCLCYTFHVQASTPWNP